MGTKRFNGLEEWSSELTKTKSSHLGEEKLRPKVGDGILHTAKFSMLVPYFPHTSSLAISKIQPTTWDIESQFRTKDKFLPNPSSIFANLVAVKGIHVENSVVFSCTSFCPRPLAIAKQKAQAWQAEA